MKKRVCGLLVLVSLVSSAFPASAVALGDITNTPVQSRQKPVVVSKPNSGTPQKKTSFLRPEVEATLKKESVAPVTLPTSVDDEIARLLAGAEASRAKRVFNKQSEEERHAHALLMDAGRPRRAARHIQRVWQKRQHARKKHAATQLQNLWHNYRFAYPEGRRYERDEAAVAKRLQPLVDDEGVVPLGLEDDIRDRVLAQREQQREAAVAASYGARKQPTAVAKPTDTFENGHADASPSSLPFARTRPTGTDAKRLNAYTRGLYHRHKPAESKRQRRLAKARKNKKAALVEDRLAPAPAAVPAIQKTVHLPVEAHTPAVRPMVAAGNDDTKSDGCDDVFEDVPLDTPAVTPVANALDTSGGEDDGAGKNDKASPLAGTSLAAPASPTAAPARGMSKSSFAIAALLTALTAGGVYKLKKWSTQYDHLSNDQLDDLKISRVKRIMLKLARRGRQLFSKRKPA
ncbi:MAG: hypothetical protein PVJ92_00110 [Candidatus Dependentiae bacterium]|jgi:hypothetical protein